MENRDLARLLGALCLEERLRIIGGLISAGHEGLSLHELSQITGLDLKIANLHLDHMTGTNMVKSLPSPTGNIFLANLELLEKVFFHERKLRRRRSSGQSCGPQRSSKH